MNNFCLPLFNGICNRLMPLASAIRLCRQSNRHLYIYWTARPGRSCLAYQGKGVEYDEIFQPLEGVTVAKSQEELNAMWPGSDIYNAEKDPDLAVVDTTTSKGIFVLFVVTPVISVADERDWLKPFVDNTTGLFPENQLTKEMREVLKELRPISSIEVMVQEMLKRFTEDMVGLHVRRTDGKFAETDWTETDRQLVKTIGNLAESGKTIFLATDSPEQERLYKTLYGKSVVTFTPAVPKFGNDDNNVKCAVVELFLLARCNRGVIGTTGSTFSVMAHLLSEGTPLWLVSEDPATARNIAL